MTREEVKKILHTEELKYYNWYDEHALHENEIGISYRDKKYIVYATDERASLISQKEFETESDALDLFIKKVRMAQSVVKYLKKTQT